MDRATGSSRCEVADSSQSSHIVNWALAVISGRDCVVDAPQSLHRHRVRPAVVFPFLTSVFAHIPHRGRLSIFFTTHAFTACAPTYIPTTTREARGSYTHFSGLNPLKQLISHAYRVSLTDSSVGLSNTKKWAATQFVLHDRPLEAIRLPARPAASSQGELRYHGCW